MECTDLYVILSSRKHSLLCFLMFSKLCLKKKQCHFSMLFHGSPKVSMLLWNDKLQWHSNTGSINKSTSIAQVKKDYTRHQTKVNTWSHHGKWNRKHWRNQQIIPILIPDCHWIPRTSWAKTCSEYATWLVWADQTPDLVDLPKRKIESRAAAGTNHPVECPQKKHSCRTQGRF